MHLFYLYFFQSSVKMAKYVELNNTDSITNSPGSSQCSASTSWKQFWIERTKLQWPANCQVKGCATPPEHGAHIRIKRRKKMYIIPMCAKCNSSSNKKLIIPTKERVPQLCIQKILRGQRVCVHN